MSVEVCRLCGKDGVTHVYDETDLWRKIFVCFGVEINTNDKITQKICKSCYFFTNSVYEFRLSSSEHDNKLKKEYAETHPKLEPETTTPVSISYPSEISQDAFLNTLNLACKSYVCLKPPVCHPSVLKLKRKWPNINIPPECYKLNIEPIISLEVPPKLLKLSLPKLGIWSVKSKQIRGKQPDLVLTRIRSTNTSESLNSNSDLNIKINSKHNNSAASASEAQQPSTSTAISPKDSSFKKKKKKYPDWCTGKNKKRRTKKSSPEKSTSQEKPPNVIPKEQSPTKSESNSVTVSPRRNISRERSKLKHLLETDAHLNETLPRCPSAERPSTTSSPDLKTEEYGNLLMAAGEEVQTFICVTCNKIFDTLALLNNHKKYSHKSSLRCTKCSKRFAIVESLVKHNLAYHPEKLQEIKESPEIVTSESSNTTQDNHSIKLRSGTVARKHTSGTIEHDKPVVGEPTQPSDDEPTQPAVGEPTEAAVGEPTQLEILEYIISDDDDVEITDVIEPTNSCNSNKESPLENIIAAALEPQKSSNTDASNSPLLYDGLIPQISSVYSEKPQDVSETLSKPADDDIFLIDDSEDEKNDKTSNNQATNEEEQAFIVLDDSNSSKETELAASTSSTSSTDVKSKSDMNISQKIVVVPSAEDKAHMEASSSVKAKITNELSYINYIFNKCNFGCLKTDSPKTAKPERKWLLKDIHKFTEKTILPVRLSRVVGEDVSVEYSPVVLEKPLDKLPFWDTTNAIDVARNIIMQKDVPPQPKSPPKKIIVKESSFVSQPVVKKSTSNVETSVLKPAATSTSVIKSTNIHTPVTTQETNLSSASLVSNVVQTPTTMSTPVALVRSTNIQNTSNIVSNTMFVVSQSPQTVGNIQVVTSSPTGTFQNNPRNTNVSIPSVAVSSPVLQKVQSPANLDIQTTQKLLNFALQNAAMSKSPVRSYSKAMPSVVTNSKPMLPLSPSSVVDTVVGTPDLQETCNGYILVGVSATPNETSGVILDESNGGQKQPIVLNGMSYPSFAKIRNTNTPTFVLQQLGQQTNVNIQNCINICQQEVVTTNTINEQFTVPYIIREQSTAPIVSSPAAPLTVQSMAPIMIQSVPSIVQSTATTETTSDTTVSTTRPSIRIKNLSELTGDNLNTNQRNELHNLYSNTLTNYVQNYSNTVANQSQNDEYLQIS